MADTSQPPAVVVTRWEAQRLQGMLADHAGHLEHIGMYRQAREVRDYGRALGVGTPAAAHQAALAGDLLAWLAVVPSLLPDTHAGVLAQCDRVGALPEVAATVTEVGVQACLDAIDGAGS